MRYPQRCRAVFDLPWYLNVPPLVADESAGEAAASSHWMKRFELGLKAVLSGGSSEKEMKVDFENTGTQTLIKGINLVVRQQQYRRANMAFQEYPFELNHTQKLKTGFPGEQEEFQDSSPDQKDSKAVGNPGKHEHRFVN